MQPSILILSGPNLNLLGTRQPEIYGNITLSEIHQLLENQAQKQHSTIQCIQSNHEGVLIDCIQQAEANGHQGIVLNPGGYAHSSVALRDAVAANSLPVIEVHMSNIHARESFRQTSLLASVCIGSVVGLGVDSYYLGWLAMLRRIRK